MMTQHHDEISDVHGDLVVEKWLRNLCMIREANNAQGVSGLAADLSVWAGDVLAPTDCGIVRCVCC